MGWILQDLKSWNYRIADVRYRENLDRSPAIFETGAARQIDFATRLEAAEALGQAGDPRLDPDKDNWVKVEGGPFWMGAQNEDAGGRNYDERAWGNQSPVKRVTVQAFCLGRYPVTVFEYERFVKAGGYRRKEPWTAVGHERFAEPDNWRRQLEHPNRPVVGVSWHEAAAYCQWAPEDGCPLNQSGNARRDAAERVFAVRGGNEEPDEHRANFVPGGGPGYPTPVGLYPGGATPSAIDDLAGNVHEWVQDGHGKYSETEAKNPRGPEEGKRKMLRGGARVNPARLLRVSDRASGGPEARDIDLGFRCARNVNSN